MHEVGIARQAVELALEAAGGARITRIKLRIGRLAGVVPQALEFAFDAVTAGTLAEGASLEWEETPILCRCESGCPDFQPAGAIFRCGVCGVISSDILSGRELEVAEIDVETQENPPAAVT